ncbi:MAG: phage portal protein [Candidatus Helarchaeota archaeon]
MPTPKGTVTTDRLFTNKLKPAGRLSFPLIETIYEKVAIVRQCVDFLSKLAGEAIWFVAGPDPSACKEIEDWLKAINVNYEDLNDLVQKIVFDLVLYDISFIEIVRTRGHEIVELWVRAPHHFEIEVDDHGRILSYIQKIEGKEIKFKRNEIIHMVYHTRSNKIWGFPILNTIEVEVASLVLASRNLMDYLGGTTPDGILLVPYLNDEEYEKLKQQLEEAQEIPIMRGVTSDDVSWIELASKFDYKSYPEVKLQLESIVFQNFGINPGDFGYATETTSKTNLPFSVKITTERTIKPLLSIIARKLTNQLIVPSFGEEYSLKFLVSSPGEDEIILRSISDAIRYGAITINESRRILSRIYGINLPEVEDGDRNIMILGNKIEKLPIEEVKDGAE